jgi:hypothetical protein
MKYQIATNQQQQNFLFIMNINWWTHPRNRMLIMQSPNSPVSFLKCRVFHKTICCRNKFAHEITFNVKTFTQVHEFLELATCGDQWKIKLKNLKDNLQCLMLLCFPYLKYVLG